MANPMAALVASVLPAPRRHALIAIAASPSFLQECRVQRNGRKPLPYASFACSAAERAAGLPFIRGIRATSSCSEYVEERSFAGGNTLPTMNKEREARIREHLEMEEPRYLPSPLDTAWVAMVPSTGSNPQAPRFPQCVEWILQNQHDDGSWGTNGFDDSSVSKDNLLSTLACVVALKKWNNAGSEQIKRGLQFVTKNLSFTLDEQTDAPVGFNLTFPSLLSHAIRLGLDFPASENNIGQILHLRDVELERFAGENTFQREAYFAYIAEGSASLVDWKGFMKFQRRNGSLFNSPATTAVACVHNHDNKALSYLDHVVEKFGGGVPTVYPLNLYSQLSMVDTLNKVGISRHFSCEIKSILDKTYHLWLHRDEEVMLDLETCAMTFRLLRMNGYDVSPEEFSHLAEASTFHKSLEGYLDDTKTLLELYKASQVSLSANESILDEICCWSGRLLNDKLRSGGSQISPEVESAIKFPFYASVEPLDHRRNIEFFDAVISPKRKTKSLLDHVNRDILALAVEDFNLSQAMYQAELQQLESWDTQNKLDQLPFIRRNLTNSYLSAVFIISAHELSDARVACAKSVALTLVTDDFFDVGGSKEEQENLISLVEKWDQHHEVQFYSKNVEVVFNALYNTVNHLGARASVAHNRDVTKYIVESWLEYLRSCATDAEWQRSKYVPTMEEYMANGIVSNAVGPTVVTALYLSGQNLWEDIINDPEYKELFRLMNTCQRLLNDTRSIERDREDGRLNSVSLLVLYSGGSMSTESAKKAVLKSIPTYRRDLLRLVLREGSNIPKICREMFWRLYKTSHVFYSEADGYSSPKEMMGAFNAVVNEPVLLEEINASLVDQLKI